MTMALPYSYQSPLPYLASGATVDAKVRALDTRLMTSRRYLKRYDEYYEGEQPLKYMAPAMVREIGEHIQQLVVNVCRAGADAYENRLDIEGFRYPDQAEGASGLADVWQANNLDEQSQQAHSDSIVLGRAYGIVGPGDSRDDAPIVSVESPFQVTTLRDPRSRKISSMLKRWDEADGSRWALLLEPNVTRTLVFTQNGWTPTLEDAHNMGSVSGFVLPNAPRTMRPDGRSEFFDIIPLIDAVNKMATDMMISAEYHAMPRRWIFGLKKSDFIQNGKQANVFSMIKSHLWSSENADAKAGQFPEADLKNFHDSIKLLIQISSQLLSLPPHYMAFVSDNPASADAIRSSESQLVKRVERKHTYLGGGWEDGMRQVLRLQTGKWDPQAQRLETVWRDPSTPTVAQKADAIQKLVTAKVMPIQMAWEELGWSEPKRALALKYLREEQSNPDFSAALDAIVNAA